MSHRLSLIAWWLIALFSIQYFFTTRAKQDRVFDSDTMGYYMYLPSLFLNNGQARPFSWTNETTFPQGFQSNCGLNVKENGALVDKYYIGTALCELPFFALGHVGSLIFEDEHHGFTHWHHMGVLIGGICFLLFGVWQLRRWLQEKGISDLAIALVLLLLFFATNLIHYALHEPGMSHVYSFALIATFIRRLDLQLRHASRKNLYLLAALFGLLVLVRPVNVLILLALIPLAGNLKTVLQFIRDQWTRKLELAAAIGIFIGFIFLQSITYYIQSGHWWVDSYDGEHFDFAHAHIAQVLWSYRKGWLLYTPLMLFALGGIALMYRNKFQCIAWSIWLFILVFITSSWTCWWYGGSFSQRPFIDHYALLAFPLALMIDWLLERKRIWQIVSGCVLTFFLILNQVQWNQYKIGILPYDEITQEAYWHMFMQTGVQFIEAHSLYDKFPHPPKEAERVSVAIMNFEPGCDTADWPQYFHSVLPSTAAFDGKYLTCVDFYHNASATFRKPLKKFIVPEILDAVRAGKMRLWIEYTFKAKLTNRNASVYSTIAQMRGDQVMLWDAMPLLIQIHQADSWSIQRHFTMVPSDVQGDDELVINVTNQSKEKTWIDDVIINLYLEKLP